MKSILILVAAIILAGCQTLPSVDCTEGLSPDLLTKQCALPEPVVSGQTFEQVNHQSGIEKAELLECRVRNSSLQEALRNCSKVIKAVGNQTNATK